MDSEQLYYSTYIIIAVPLSYAILMINPKNNRFKPPIYWVLQSNTMNLSFSLESTPAWVS